MNKEEILNECPKCDNEMALKGIVKNGDTIDGDCENLRIYQCPMCKNIEIE